MDVFYPLKTGGSKHENLELRYSLRALEKNVSGIGSVFIATEHLPTWLTNVIHLPIPDDIRKVADWNIQHKICRAEGISPDFLFMNDDHFIMQPYHVDTFPNYYHSTLDNYCRRRGKDGYGRRCINSMNWLNEHNLKLLFFDIHYPIVYNLQRFKDLMQQIPWEKEKHGFVIKSLYGNYYHLPGTYTHDNKINHLPVSLPVFSTYNYVKTSIFTYLQQRFPKKSRFER